MKTLYIDCGMGAAGDMLTAALLELHPDPKAFLEKLNRLGIPGVKVEAEPSVKCGVTGTHVSVTINGEEEESCDVHNGHEHHHDDEHEHHHHHDDEHEHEHHHDDEHEHHHHHDDEHEHEHHHHHDDEHEHHHDDEHEHAHHHHHHSGMSDIAAIIGALPVSDKVKQDVTSVYAIIAEAEGHVHGKPVDEIHFHEVGTMDAIADVTAVCLLIEELGADRIVSSPIHVGSGKVRCAHGILPVPAPATAHILRGVPIYSGDIKGELCTPTGAALLKHFSGSFGPMPAMRVDKYGYGMGMKEFAAANCVRACIGESGDGTDDVAELSCNLDDMTGEEIAFAEEILLNKGALDVYTTPIGMKKGRPAVMLTCMCRPDDVEDMSAVMLRHTTTLGVRVNTFRRYILRRSEDVISTELGDIGIKKSSGWGAEKYKLEYADLSRIARENDMTLSEVRKLALNK